MVQAVGRVEQLERQVGRRVLVELRVAREVEVEKGQIDALRVSTSRGSWDATSI